MKLKLFILAAVFAGAASVQYGGDYMQSDTRIIRLYENSSFTGLYASFCLSYTGNQYEIQGDFNPGERGKNITRKVNKIISKKTFESLFEECLGLDTKKIVMGNLKTPGRDGSDVTLTFGSGLLTVSIAVWSPYGSAKERELTRFMEIYMEIYKLAE